MRDIILGRKVGTANTVRARRVEKRMVEACERRILQFPLGMDAREVAKELKREGWYAWAAMKVLFPASSGCGQKRETEGNAYGLFDCAVRMPEIIPPVGTNDFGLGRQISASFPSAGATIVRHPRAHGRKTPPAPAALRSQFRRALDARCHRRRLPVDSLDCRKGSPFLPPSISQSLKPDWQKHWGLGFRTRIAACEPSVGEPRFACARKSED
jgi:hypothetical protein